MRVLVHQLPSLLQLYSRPRRLLSGALPLTGEGQAQDKSAVTSLLDGLTQAFEEASSQVGPRPRLAHALVSVELSHPPGMNL